MNRSVDGDPTRPTLVLLPGLDGTRHLFEPVIDALRLPVMQVDYPATTPAGYEALLPFVRSQLPSTGAFVLVGWSFSGPLALAAAAEAPTGLRGVVLVASFVTKPVPYLPRASRHLARPLLFRLTPFFSRTKALLGGYRTPALDALLRRAHTGVPPAVMAERVRATLTVDARQALLDCPVPILYLAAAKDRVVPAHNTRQITALRDDVEVRTIDGPHLAMATNPVAAAAAVEEFVAALPEPGID